MTKTDLDHSPTLHHHLHPMAAADIGNHDGRLRVTGTATVEGAVEKWMSGHGPSVGVPDKGNGRASGDDSDNSDISTVETHDAQHGHKDEVAPNRAHIKRGRSLRTNVLLRTKGVLMSGANGSGGGGGGGRDAGAVGFGDGPLTPGIVLTYGDSDPIPDEPPQEKYTLQKPFRRAISPPTPDQRRRRRQPSGNAAIVRSSDGFPMAALDSNWGGPARDPIDPLADTVWWGWAILFGTWAVFVMGMGSVFGVWDWVWGVGEPPFPVSSLFKALDGADDEEFPIRGYYPALLILTMVMAWVWVITAWVGMKYFKHAKIQPQSD